MCKGKLSIRHNSKGIISLFVGNCTAVPVENLVDLQGSKSFIKEHFGAIKGKRENYFDGKTKEAKHNNNQLNNLLEAFESLVENNPTLETPRDIVNAYQGKDTTKPKEQEAPKTLESFLDDRINYIRDVEDSSNYKRYITAKNNVIKYLPTLAKKPLGDIINGDIILLQETLRSKAPSAYNETMKRVQAIIKKAKLLGYNNNEFTFNWESEKPHQEQPHQYISDEALTAIFNMDLNTVRGKLSLEKCSTFMHIVHFMYNTQSRPVDVMQLNVNDIILGDDGNYYWKYTPAKKTTKTNKGKKPQEATAPLNKEALAIINQYQANELGYIFPLTTNKRKYENEIVRGNVRNTILFDINKLLKRIGEKVGISKLTVYDFRKTRITNLVSYNTIPLMAIAKASGTSVKMIDKHYTAKDKIVGTYFNNF